MKVSAFIVFVIACIGGVVAYWHFVTLPQFVALIREDPLFYSPGIDTVQLRHEGERMKHLHQAILLDGEEYLKDAGLEDVIPVAQGIRDGFLPVNFIQAFPTAIDEVDTFLGSPTFFHAVSLLSVDTKTARAYQEDAHRLLESLQKTADALGNNPSTLVYLSSYGTTDTALRDAIRIAENGDQLVIETFARTKCLLLGICPEVKPYEPKQISLGVPSIETFTLLPDSAFPTILDGVPRTGPFVVESGCFPERFTPLYLYQDDSVGFYIKEADQSYYQNLEVRLEKNQDDAYARLFMENGIPFDDQPEAASYRCADLSYWGDVATLAYLATHGIAHATSSESLTSVYEATPYNREGALVIENRLPYFEEMIVSINRWLEVDLYLGEERYTPPNGTYLLAARSAYSLLFGTFSRSIWRTGEKLEFHVKENQKPDASYATYTDLRNRYSEEEIKKFDVFASKEFYQSLGNKRRTD